MVTLLNWSSTVAIAKSVVTSSQKESSIAGICWIKTLYLQNCEWFQVKIRTGTKKKDGPVSGLKSAGPRGRFQFLGAAGPVSYL